ncbi:hypothetical protein BD779DRAFT_1452643 [Infundibulicybe gibba]|nr:hypothetical protein BD779DRAFT_1452643 [Infundibulicybe gibba]
MSAPAVQSQRVAIVTGAAQGIGRAIALQLAEDGLDIALNDLPSQGSLLQELVKEIEAKGRKAISVPGSVTKEEDVKELVDATVRHFGRLDAVRISGGVVGHVADLDMREWDSMWDVNIRGVLFCYKYAAQQMIKQGFGGRIIGLTFERYVTNLIGFANAGAYCASKAVVISVTQTAALELKEHGITVNAYAPGIVDTPLSKRTMRGCENQMRTHW